MKDNLKIGIIALLIIGLIGAGVVSVYGRDYSRQKSVVYLGMPDEVEAVLEDGNYSDLVVLREKYQMPVMPWIQNEEDFQSAQERYLENNSLSNMPCHMWN